MSEATKRTVRNISMHGIGTTYDRKFTPLVRLALLDDNIRGACAPCAPVVPPPMYLYIVCDGTHISVRGRFYYGIY